MNLLPYQQHIESLCATHGISLAWGGKGRAWRKVRRVRTPMIKSGVTYAIALHEIGHLLGPGQSGLVNDRKISRFGRSLRHAHTLADHSVLPTNNHAPNP